MSNLIVTGMKAVLRQTQAKLLYVVNLMTVFTQTHGYSAADHVRVIESAIGRRLDYILINQEAIPAKILSAYRQQQEFPVTDDLPHEARIIRAPLITQRLVKAEPGDTVSRSFLRHNSRRLANQIISLCH